MDCPTAQRPADRVEYVISHNVYYVRGRCTRRQVPGIQAGQPALALALPNGPLVSTPDSSNSEAVCQAFPPRSSQRHSSPGQFNIGSIFRASSAGTRPAQHQPEQTQAADTGFNPCGRDVSRK